MLAQTPAATNETNASFEQAITSPIPEAPVLQPFDNAQPVTNPVTETLMRIQEGNRAVKKVRERDEGCASCELANEYSAAISRSEQVQRKFKAKESNQEGSLVPPSKDENTSGIRSAMCGTRKGNYDVCISDGDVTPSRFTFTNRIDGKNRLWSFHFENGARQDLAFSISDSPDGRGSTSKETYIMLFPRKYLPAIRIEGDKQIVTLPTGEVVVYDVTTKRVLSGVFSENKTYSGNGVMIRADQTGNDARYGRKNNSTATITKQGKTCKVAKSHLWPDQSDSSALHFKFATDEAFDAFLKQKCGFGL